MKSDELIDDVAARMTALDGRPDVQARVVAAIAASPRRARQAWGWPAAAAATAALALAAWLMMPSSIRTDETPLVVADRVTVEQPEPSPALVETVDERVTVSDAAAARQTADAPAAPVTAPTEYAAAAADFAPAPVDVWTETAMETIPLLPPLAGPPPIEIEPITWSDVTIAPLTVEQLHIDALVIEPLRVVGVSGV